MTEYISKEDAVKIAQECALIVRDGEVYDGEAVMTSRFQLALNLAIAQVIGEPVGQVRWRNGESLVKWKKAAPEAGTPLHAIKPLGEK